MINELYNVMKKVTANGTSQWCREILGGMLLIRRGEIACTLGSARRDLMNSAGAPPHKDVSPLTGMHLVLLDSKGKKV
jgi:hypothetical protein